MIGIYVCCTYRLCVQVVVYSYNNYNNIIALRCGRVRNVTFLHARKRPRRRSITIIVGQRRVRGAHTMATAAPGGSILGARLVHDIIITLLLLLLLLSLQPAVRDPRVGYRDDGFIVVFDLVKYRPVIGYVDNAAMCAIRVTTAETHEKSHAYDKP